MQPTQLRFMLLVLMQLTSQFLFCVPHEIYESAKRELLAVAAGRNTRSGPGQKREEEEEEEEDLSRVRWEFSLQSAERGTRGNH